MKIRFLQKSSPLFAPSLFAFLVYTEGKIVSFLYSILYYFYIVSLIISLVSYFLFWASLADFFRISIFFVAENSSACLGIYSETSSLLREMPIFSRKFSIVSDNI